MAERQVNKWIEDAYARGASDLHFEPAGKASADKVRIRMRVDGKMRDVETVGDGRKVLSRLKLMAELDPNEKFTCLDGRINYAAQGGNAPGLDLRLNSTPCLGGEKIVLRLIDNRKLNLSLEKLGFTASMLKVYRELTSTPHGMILHVGPTGSGKTTSLYSLMKTLHTSEVNIQTVEDPIEYNVDGIAQTQVNPEYGLSFPKVLRSLLRQDPDVIMVGEIRDAETAEIATEAAMTGHLVLSTLHTNDSVGTVVRLLDMGIAPHSIAYALRCVVSQRFARRLCKCARKVEPNDVVVKLTGVARPVYEAGSCSRCFRSGYSGRIPLFELLPTSAALRKAVYVSSTPDALEQVARKNGLITLWQDGLQKVFSGITSLEEVLRVAKGVRRPDKLLKGRRRPKPRPGRSPQPPGGTAAMRQAQLRKSAGR